MPESERRPGLPVRVLALACLVVPQVVMLLVQGAAPVLLRDAPLLLLVLYPIEPWSLLVSQRIDAVRFVAVIVGVRLPLYVGDYFAGRWYGERGLAWLASRSRATRAFQRLFGRAGGPLLVVFPGATVSVLAGSTGMPLRRFLPLIASGVLLAAVFTRLLGEVAAAPIGAVTGFIERYAVPVGAVLLVLVAGDALLRARRSRAGQRPVEEQQERDGDPQEVSERPGEAGWAPERRGGVGGEPEQSEAGGATGRAAGGAGGQQR